VLDRLGVPAQDTLLVGDRLATDVHLAKEAGMAGALVLTGATSLEEALGSEDRPDYILDNLAELLPSRDEPSAAARVPENRED
ncbi:MAG: HAD hydrolase-like protein, partial [Actinobacteria bacterium]|nr:HAD hydrolase-like protein [Actinomycetota bacterium]